MLTLGNLSGNSLGLDVSFRLLKVNVQHHSTVPIVDTSVNAFTLGNPMINAAPGRIPFCQFNLSYHNSPQTLPSQEVEFCSSQINLLFSFSHK
ncbi:hypothetical protein Y032_0018g3583 [Ancylostoma ceylanicum]|uniref:Uncharacterized protein n=1 Tax=Ancylostoma ceylanicum TaxID=53326 RepID=A0A016V571_9BILA|nr:hypothetical protein Y032_0018g3583 [Ancylostoma ceylanicum]